LQRPQGQHTLTSTHTRTQFFLIPICQTSFSLLLLLLLLGCYSHERKEVRKEGRKEENWACFVGGRILLQQLEVLVISRFFAACF